MRWNVFGWEEIDEYRFCVYISNDLNFTLIFTLCECFIMIGPVEMDKRFVKCIGFDILPQAVSKVTTQSLMDVTKATFDSALFIIQYVWENLATSVSWAAVNACIKFTLLIQKSFYFPSKISHTRNLIKNKSPCIEQGYISGKETMLQSVANVKWCSLCEKFSSELQTQCICVKYCQPMYTNVC